MRAADLQSTEPGGDSFKVRLLHTAVRLLREFCSQLEGLPAVREVLGPCSAPLAHLPLDRYPPAVRHSVQELSSALDALASTRLQLLLLDKKKPKALRLYEPNIQQRMIDLHTCETACSGWRNQAGENVHISINVLTHSGFLFSASLKTSRKWMSPCKEKG
ncbi:hypothetical protein PR048_033300 [Dryococelus australis]|uniref:Uncharacterized protein n=1 Tax=Dryococelus australis TaxID=614101 RepID=A0ABQ9FZX3_9NEOP|nr:hypothetical protein PR048_033300 [Dryococelus australis]